MSERERWIEAGKTLAEDPAALVECPRCGNARLIVTDAAIDGVIERHMRCRKCGAYNALRLRPDVTMP